MGMTATYDPADDKLRLYADSRLSPELYERVKAAGFRWAPKQELFVAPAWTPEREDLLLELCGEIGDEDTTLVGRAEAKADRLEDLSGRKAVAAERTLAAVDALAGGIPLGQPILVGHHSEKHARKHKEKIESGTRKAVDLWSSSKYWADRAQGALCHAKYKEQPAVRARRIKKLEAELRKLRKSVAGTENLVKVWASIKTIEQGRVYAGRTNGPGLCKSEGRSYGWNAYDLLKPDGERYAECPSWTLEQVQEATAKVCGRALARAGRWVAHYENRLAYERAMLGEQTGVAADLANGRVLPEKGGACKCWVFRGGWLYVKKVNKVSVTVADNWGRGGENFTRTVPFDSLSGLMTAAEVEAARAGGRLQEAETKVGFVLLDEPVRAPRPAPEMDATAAKFEDLESRLRSGRVVETAVAPTLFPTPADVVGRMVELAEIEAGMTVLEPSAGTGAIAERLPPPAANPLTLVELNVALANRLRAKFPGAAVHCEDFLEVVDLGPFDRVLMNPPFDKGQDVAHVRHAMGFVRPGGRLVAVVANGPRQREAFEPVATAWVDLPEDTFKAQGTSVRAAVVVLDKE